MRIWVLKSDANHVAWLRSEPVRTHEEHLAFDGRPLPAEWKKLPLIQIDEEKELSKHPLADAVTSDSCFLISEKAKDVLAAIAGEKAEFLPYGFNGIPYYLINSMDIVDCIDKAESDLKMSPTDGKKILMVKQFVLNEAKMEGHHLFRIAGYLLNGPFVTDKVVDVIRKARLTGFRFDLIWEDHKQAPGTKIYTGGFIRSEYSIR